VKLAASAVLWVGLEGIPGLLLAAVVSALVSLLILRAQGYDLHGKLAISFGPDPPLNFHPAAIRVSAGFTPSGAGENPTLSLNRRTQVGGVSRYHQLIVGEIESRLTS
jgi:hypothetical protein